MGSVEYEELMYSSLPNLIIGFHGCDETVFDKVIRQNEPLKPSDNDYDWLGNGIYFWEQNLQRAWEWAEQHTKRSKEKVKPAVIGAVIDLKYCLNLLDRDKILTLQNHYKYFEVIMDMFNEPMPENKNVGKNTDLLLRKLDCAVIESLHQFRADLGFKRFDSVRGVFFEGGEIYPNSGFREQSHIQLCIRNPNCIKGYFAPREFSGDWD